MGIAAGILLILISIAHNIYGEAIQIPSLKKHTEDPIQIGSQRIMLFQGGLLLLVVGIIQVLVSVGMVPLTGITRFFPVGIVLINFFTAFFISLFHHKEILKIAAPQFAVFMIIICLQLFSLWRTIGN